VSDMRTRVIVLFVILLGVAGVVARADRYEQIPPRAHLSGFPMELDGWHGIEEPPLSKAVLDVLRADDYLTRSYYTSDRAIVGLYIGYWQSQRQGDTVHSPLNCLPGSGWEPLSQATVPIRDPDTLVRADGTMNRVVIQKGLDRQLVLYWYQSHGRMVGSEYWSKFYLITDAVRMNRTDGSIVRVIAPIRGEGTAEEQRAERDARRFVAVLLPKLDGFLPM